MRNLWSHLRETGNVGRYIRHVLSRHLPIIAYLILAGATAYSMMRVSEVARTNREIIRTNTINTAQRLDQICTLFETDRKANVKQLTETYKYLVALKPSEKNDTINQFIIRSLPETEANAKDVVPKFCNSPKVGLPEPNPKVPPRPKELRP